MNRYDKLYIIGNGLDLHCGMPTKYSDFREYMFDTLDKTYGYDGFGQFIDRYPNLCPDWHNFEDALGQITCQPISDSFEEYHDMYEAEVDPMDDPDYAVVNASENTEEEVSSFDEESLRKYLREWVRSIPLPSGLSFETLGIIDTEGTLYISFNYTKTLEQAGVDSSRICHIHGAISDESNDLVIGHAAPTGNIKKSIDDADTKYCPSIEDRQQDFFPHGAFDKANRIVDATEKQTFDLIAAHKDFFELISGVKTIETLGFGFGEADMPYIEKIASIASKSVSWEIRCHDTTARDEAQKMLQKHSLELSAHISESY